MARQVKLKAERRTAIGRSATRKLKTHGIVPAVMYGAKEKAQPLQISEREIKAMLSRAAGENILVELEIDGDQSARLALVQEIQHSPVRGDVLHIDFHAVSMDEKIHAEVPLEPSGIANGVKNFGGLLEQSLRALAIECLPRDLPDRIVVDVSALNIGDSIHVRDLQLPPGVTTRVAPDLTALSVIEPSVEEAPVAAAPGVTEPEVITEKKPEGEAEAAPAGKEKAAAPKEKEAK
jgi:large subunit ribosomal protein L25